MSSKSDVNTVETTDGGLDLFGRYLSVWVAVGLRALPDQSRFDIG